MTGPPSVKPGSLRPWRHCGAVVPPVILILGAHNHATANGSADDVVPGIAGATPGNAIGLGIDAYLIGWNPRPGSSFAGSCDSFHLADPLLPVLSPSPVCVTAPVLGPFRHSAGAPRRLKPSSLSEPTPLLVRTLPPSLSVPYLPAVFAVSPSMLIPEKIPWSRLVHALLNAPQTSLSFESLSNHSFVGGPHGGRQL